MSHSLQVCYYTLLVTGVDGEALLLTPTLHSSQLGCGDMVLDGGPPHSDTHGGLPLALSHT